MTTGDEDETTESVIARHLGLHEDMMASVKRELFQSYISATPIGPETGKRRKSIEDFKIAVKSLRETYENLPRSQRDAVRRKFRSIFFRPNRFIGPVAHEREPVEKSLKSFEASSRQFSALDHLGKQDKSNWRAIAIVDFCRKLWRTHTGREPPLQVAHVDTFNRANPFTAFVADVMKSEGVDGEAHTAVRAWRRTMHRSDEK